MQFTDNTTLANTRLTADGYLVGNVACAKVGVQTYHSSEVGGGSGLINVYRDESEVFALDSLASFVGKPVTNDHPPVEVKANNWKQFAVGSIGEGVLRDGEHIKVPVTLMDAETIKAVQNGKREISMGYTAELEWVDGVTPDGQAYQARQKNIRINHLAIVDKGRAGATCRFGDALWGDTSPKNNTGEKPVATRTVMVDGLPIETTDNGAVAIEKLQQDKAAAEKLLLDAQALYDSKIADKDAQLAAKDAEIDALKAKQLTDAEIDAKVAARSELIATAKAIHDADYTGKSDAEIKAAALIAKGVDVKDKPQAYIDARFDIEAENIQKADPFADAMRGGMTGSTVADNGYQAYTDSLTKAWERK
ncbi:hypothetical protein A9308_00620 [Moraxella atlantae]|uniref:DUF2213 domain-containing protein n=1 Tax=Faucicola atlantae TaxID=34059 RepID=A0A1B8Q8Z2_9GAMM|nr:DUF2213 domain-containing protein [Moraxella atlantae]OBX73747.1 hypothetical protein A9308_00620 [Moraxella atlantae]